MLLDKANDSLTEEMNKLTVGDEKEEEEEAVTGSGGQSSEGQVEQETAAVNDDKETGTGLQEAKSQEEKKPSETD